MQRSNIRVFSARAERLEALQKLFDASGAVCHRMRPLVQSAAGGIMSSRMAVRHGASGGIIFTVARAR